MNVQFYTPIISFPAFQFWSSNVAQSDRYFRWRTSHRLPTDDNGISRCHL